MIFDLGTKYTLENKKKITKALAEKWHLTKIKMKIKFTIQQSFTSN